MQASRTFVAGFVAAYLLNATAALSKEAAPEEPDRDANTRLADEFLTAYKDPAGGNFYNIAYQVERALEKSDAAADETAEVLLKAKSDIVANEAVVKLLDAMANDGKAPLAAEWMVQIAGATRSGRSKEPPKVVVGQLIVGDEKLDPTMVLAQMPILKEGYFASVVGDLQKPVSFRAHRYQDLDVALTGKEGEIIDVGEVKLDPLTPDQQASLRGSVALDAASTAESAEVTVNASIGPINTPSNGFSGRMRWPDGVKVAVDTNGEFHVDGLNPSEYSVVVSAADHVDRYQKVKLTAGEEHDAGTLRLFSKDLGFYVGAKAPSSEELAWETDYQAALARAKAEKRPIFVMMTAPLVWPVQISGSGDAQRSVDPALHVALHPGEGERGS